MYVRLITRPEFEAKQQGTSGVLSPVVIGRATYLGGRSWLGEHRIADIQITIDHQGCTGSRSVSVDSFGREQREVVFSLPWSAVERIGLESGDHPNMAAWFLAAGLVGMALAKQKVFLVIATTEGDALFGLSDRHPERIRRKLAPWLSKHARDRSAPDSASPAAPGSPAGSAVDRLQELGDLRDRGVLDPAEFERLKSQLLSELD